MNNMNMNNMNMNNMKMNCQFIDLPPQVKMTQFIVHQLVHYIVMHYKSIVHQLMHYKLVHHNSSYSTSVGAL